MSDIIASFEGPYKEQRTIHSNWLKVRNSDIPKPHPAKVDSSDMVIELMACYVC